jgi:hypothetical protein
MRLHEAKKQRQRGQHNSTIFYFMAYSILNAAIRSLASRELDFTVLYVKETKQAKQSQIFNGRSENVKS